MSWAFDRIMSNNNEVDKADEKLLHLLISRRSARESSSLTFLVISSSASLVLLGFILNCCNLEEFWFIPIFGILFPVLGLLYSEITNRTIQKYDHDQIRKLILKKVLDVNEKNRIKKIILYNKRRVERGICSRLLLFSPIVAWFVVIISPLPNDYSKCLSLFGIISISGIIIWALTKSDCLPDNEDECKDD